AHLHHALDLGHGEDLRTAHRHRCAARPSRAADDREHARSDEERRRRAMCRRVSPGPDERAYHRDAPGLPSRAHGSVKEDVPPELLQRPCEGLKWVWRHPARTASCPAAPIAERRRRSPEPEMLTLAYPWLFCLLPLIFFGRREPS